MLGSPQSGVRVALRFIVGAKKQDVLGFEMARDIVKQLERRSVGPLEIVEEDEQRLLRRHSPEELRKIPEKPRLQLGRVQSGGGVPVTAAGKSGKEIRKLGGATAGEN